MHVRAQILGGNKEWDVSVEDIGITVE